MTVHIIMKGSLDTSDSTVEVEARQNLICPDTNRFASCEATYTITRTIHCHFGGQKRLVSPIYHVCSTQLLVIALSVIGINPRINWIMLIKV